MVSGRRLRLTFVVATVVVALDAVTKALAVHFLAGHGSVSIFWGAFYLDLYRNHAGPHNALAGHPVVVSLAALAAALAIALVAPRVRTTTAAVAVGLLLGAAVGNLLDRLLGAPGPLRGGVIDWLRPAWSSGSMNLADLSIEAAILVFALGTMAAWWRRRRGHGGAVGAEQAAQ